MTALWAWICAGVAALATLGAAYFFDKSAEEGISVANERSSIANEAAAKANERAALLEKEAARLSAQAEEARSEIAGANARAAEAQLALEKFKAPRLIEEAKIRSLGEQLKAYGKTRFDAAAAPGDAEAIVFLTYICTMLEIAGWTWVDWNPPNGLLAMVYNIPGKPNVGQLGFFDVLIVVNPEHASALLHPAEALVNLLKSEGFAATLEVIAHPNMVNADALHVTVGRKR
jgi:hypothetical protein